MQEMREIVDKKDHSKKIVDEKAAEKMISPQQICPLKRITNMKWKWTKRNSSEKLLKDKMKRGNRTVYEQRIKYKHK